MLLVLVRSLTLRSSTPASKILSTAVWWKTEQVKCDMHGSCIYCTWNLNQEPELPVPKQVFFFNPVKIYSHVQESVVQIWTFNSGPSVQTWFVVEIPTFWTALLLVWPATCVTPVLVISCCFFAVSGTSYFVLYMSCAHKNFMAVSWRQSRATDPKVGVKGCD
jgi:hypothetical protein